MAVDLEKKRLDKDYEENRSILKNILGVGISFDVFCHDISIAGKDACIFFVQTFVKDDILMYLLRHLADVKREELRVNTFEKLIKQYLSYIQLSTTDEFKNMASSVLMGQCAILIEGEAKAILLDMRTYVGRMPQEPDLEKVVRGSRDGFTETLVFNTQLIRRRIRDPKLRMEVMQVGRRSKSDICIAYIEDISNPELVNIVKERIGAIDIDGLPMAEKAVEELITPGSYWNPFPKVRYTERPDVAAANLFDGFILVLVDTSPSVIILPSTIFQHLSHAEEYRQSPSVGLYLRWVRYMAILGSLIVIPLWFLVAIEPSLLPKSLQFIGPKQPAKLSLFTQFLMGEFAIDLIRMAAIHVPSPISTSLGVIGALILGEAATKMGLFVPEVVFLVAVVAISGYATPSYELSMANRLARIFLILCVGFFKLPGLIVGSVALFLFLAFTKSFGVPYLYPLIPLNLNELFNAVVRRPVSMRNIRSVMLRTLDKKPQTKLSPAAMKKLPKGDEWIKNRFKR